MSATAEVLAGLAGVPITYVPNGGNAGDSLINVGFYKAANKLNLDFRVLRRSQYRDIARTDTVVLAGGGALVPEWPASPEFVKKALPRCSRLVILPQSVRGVDGLLRDLRPQDVLILRERYSYDAAISLNLKCQVLLDHDMALSVRPSDLLGQSTEFRPALSVATAARELAFAWHRARSLTRDSVLALRCDAEAVTSNDRRRIWLNDFSSVARFAPGGLAESYYSAGRFLQLIDFYDTVKTDRLHIVIGASLLGKRIIAYSNNYHKVLGVIEMSLSGYPWLEVRSLVPG